ncbi:SDR family NAD(P)-dependent oxidoreductase [Microbacterium sp. ZW T6_19]|uniref:SDR family NAD(P)-dependent oxidoreductase n=1 Tax=Microbacterium sp. ZW T6_19 TaxID=3378082 RepID=UPI003854973B
MNLEIDGRVAVVTGGASGIGQACVAALAAEGVRVAILDRDPRGAAVAAEHARNGKTVTSHEVDITDEDKVGSAIAEVIAQHGGIDILIGCAGISGPVGVKLAETDAADFDRVLAINVRGNFLMAKHAMPHLERSEAGTIVLVASDAALVAFEGMAAYSTSKAAVVMLAKAIAIDHPGIRVNAICPGIVDTPMSRTDLGRVELGFEDSALPVMKASQLARQVLFLASPASAPINATTLVSDFGYASRSALGELGFLR